MKEIDAASEVLKDELTDIWNNKKSDATCKGDMGEALVKKAIKQSFFDKGYKIRKKGPGTFRVYKQVKSGAKGRGGIDFNVTFTDDKGNSDEIFIESKNWGDYTISKDTYETEIKDRFDKVDSSNNKRKALAITKDQINKKIIKDECPKDNITIIPIDQQITGITLIGDNIKSTFGKFKKEFDNYIDDFVPKVTKVVKESIEEDIIQGKDYKVIARKWGVTVGHVRNIAPRLDIPIRKEKEWKIICYITYEEV